nr:MAG TPA: hypothetical protein [Caudoviricetes sp.]
MIFLLLFLNHLHYHLYIYLHHKICSYLFRDIFYS